MTTAQVASDSDLLLHFASSVSPKSAPASKSGDDRNETYSVKERFEHLSPSSIVPNPPSERKVPRCQLSSLDAEKPIFLDLEALTYYPAEESSFGCADTHLDCRQNDYLQVDSPMSVPIVAANTRDDQGSPVPATQPDDEDFAELKRRRSCPLKEKSANARDGLKVRKEGHSTPHMNEIRKKRRSKRKTSGLRRLRRNSSNDWDVR